MSRQLENSFRERFQKLLKGRYGDGVYIQKNHGSEYSAGLVDSIFAHSQHGRRSDYIEFKANALAPGTMSPIMDITEQPTRLQSHTLRHIEAAVPFSSWVLLFADIKPQPLVLFMPTHLVMEIRAFGRPLESPAGFTTMAEERVWGVHYWKALQQVGNPLKMLLGDWVLEDGRFVNSEPSLTILDHVKRYTR